MLLATAQFFQWSIVKVTREKNSGEKLERGDVKRKEGTVCGHCLYPPCLSIRLAVLLYII